MRHRAVHGDERVLEHVGLTRGRRLHSRSGNDLHEVVDDDVAQRADRVVEVAAILDAEALGHRDLDVRDVVAAPDRLEHRVREPQIEDLAQPHLAEKVIDAIELALIEVLMDLVGQLAGRSEVVAERLLDHDTRGLGQPGVGQALDHSPEQKRRDLQIEDRRACLPDRLCHPRVRRAIAEITTHIRQPRREALEHRLVNLHTAPLNRFAGTVAKILHRPITHRHAHDRTTEQPPLLKPVQRVKRHHLRKIARDPNTTNTSALPGLPSPPPVAGRDSTAVVIGGPFPGALCKSKLPACSGRRLDGASPQAGDAPSGPRATGRPR